MATGFVPAKRRAQAGEPFGKLCQIGAEIEKSASVGWSGCISIRAYEMDAAAGKADGSSKARQLVEPAWVRVGVHEDNRLAHPAARNSVMSFSINRGIPSLE